MNGDLFHGSHTYCLDLYYYGNDKAIPDAVLDRLKILFHEQTYTTASDEANGFFEWFSNGYIPTDNPLVWHLATQWTVKIGAARDITNTVG